MNWITLIPIIAQYGVPFAESLWKKATSGVDPTQADWDELRALAHQTSTDRMLLALQKASIDPASEQGQVLLNLTK